MYTFFLLIFDTCGLQNSAPHTSEEDVTARASCDQATQTPRIGNIHSTFKNVHCHSLLQSGFSAQSEVQTSLRLYKIHSEVGRSV
jgi:hypothetical protein